MYFLKPRTSKDPAPEYFSRYFTYEEMTHSDIAIRQGIVNVPTIVQQMSLSALCTTILDPIRGYYKRPVIVLSGFRCLELNSFMNGYWKSQHMKGEAADIWIQQITPEDIFRWVVLYSGLPYDQIILEFNAWIHITLSSRYRRKNTIAKRLENRVKYFHYTRDQIYNKQYVTP